MLVPLENGYPGEISILPSRPGVMNMYRNGRFRPVEFVLFFASVPCFNREINVALCAGVFFLRIGKRK